MFTTSMKISVAILALGLVVLVIYPFLGPQSLEAGELNGMWPEILIPIGYFVSAIGATGLAVAWMKGRSV